MFGIFLCVPAGNKKYNHMIQPTYVQVLEFDIFLLLSGKLSYSPSVLMQ